MSSLIVRVCELINIHPHPNADKLELAEVLGWQVVIPKDSFKEKDLIIFFTPDTLVSKSLAETLGVVTYLSWSNYYEGYGKIKQARLRGEPSFGLVASLSIIDWSISSSWEVNQEVSQYFDCKHYIPPIKPSSGQAEKQNPFWIKYTDIENMRNFPSILEEGEEVIITEKIHGACTSVGCLDGEEFASSHRLMKKKPETEKEMREHLSWHAWTKPGISELIRTLAQKHKQVILFGEVFGSVQSLHYGKKGQIDFIAFDLLLDGQYRDYDEFKQLCDEYKISTVPLIYRGPFSLTKTKELSEGKTLLDDSHIREGVVVKPIQERTNPRVGRVILKYVSDTYLFGKHKDQEVEIE